MIKIAISCGDPAGIGYEIVAKSLLHYHPSDVQFKIFGAKAVFDSLSEKFIWAEKFLNRVDTQNSLEIISVSDDKNFPIGEISPRCGEIAYRSIIAAIQSAKEGDSDAIVTAPISKKAIHLAGHNFAGHTEILAKEFDCPVTMMLFARKFRVSLATTHIPLKDVASSLSTARILEHLRRTHSALVNWFGIKEPKIGVLGLNPHAGESGDIGIEEIIISKAIEIAREENIDAEGPLVPDVAFLTSMRRKYDAYLAMFHDQGLIPLKTLGFRNGVNITLGLPKPRTSPDHGTAFDIAGKGKANPHPFGCSLRTGVRLSLSCNTF
ncbi:4-hydroxythreonine-4-phosphate dehydrogenase PdxA [bacterium]|nr:4-hydroxythreonine-4-phosphate dehydrogenase PdxA [bacterium]